MNKNVANKPLSSLEERGDDVNMHGEVIPHEEVLAEEDTQDVGEKSTIFAIKTSIGYEKMVADKLAFKAKQKKAQIYSILSPGTLRGYILMECIDNREAMEDFVKGIKHLRSIVEGSSMISEIEHFLTPKPAVSGIVEGDIVEIISGPFKGEKAKVKSKDEAKEEITVELLEAMIAIPVTIRGDSVRVLKHKD
jgi:transcriptional antiterminator NusG